MSEAFGTGNSFFQDTLTSTPFQGTMADTSTPTPAGTVQQSPELPAATERPGNAGNSERARKVIEHMGMLEEVARRIAEAKPQEEEMNWQRRMYLGMHGRLPDGNSPAALYQKAAALDQVMGRWKDLSEELRLIQQGSPYDQAEQAALARKTVDSIFDQGDRARRSRIITKLEKSGYPVDPVKATEWIHNPTSNLAKGGVSPEDLIKNIEGAIRIGRTAGPKAVQELTLAGALSPMAGQAGMHAAEQDISAAATKKEIAKQTYDGMTSAQVMQSAQSLYKSILASMPMTGEETYYTKDILGAPVEAKRSTHLPADFVEARAQTARRFPLILKAHPQWVDLGDAAQVSAEQADEPTPASGSKDGEIDVPAIKAMLHKDPKSTAK